MKAAQIVQFGPPSVIKNDDLPRPEPGPGQLLVRYTGLMRNPTPATVLASSLVPPPSPAHERCTPAHYAPR